MLEHEWHDHYHLNGKHALLSPSNYAWLNYTDEKMKNRYINNLKKDEGTYLHDLASRLIKTKKKLAPLKAAINQFVNDAIGFRMESEQLLYYSDNCFGTADAIIFKDNLLRIHDLKTGVGPVSFKQLDIYAALFCLEYNINPKKIEIETRLYQGMSTEIDNPDPESIRAVMDKIVFLDSVLNEAKVEKPGLF